MYKLIRRFRGAAFVLILLLSIIAPIQSVQAIPEYTYGDGSVENPYRIRTCGELHEIMGPGMTYIANLRLVSSLDCTGYDFTNFQTWLHGNVEGDGHTISNLSMGAYGLFFAIEDGTVSNLRIEGTTGSSSANGMGGFAKVAINSNFINVHSTITMTNAGSFSGGIVGEATDTSFENSSYIGDMESLSGGGLVGKATNVTITDCYTSGTMSGNQNGGMVGAESMNVVLTNVVGGMAITGTNSGGVVGPFSDGVTVNSGMFTGASEPLVTGSNIIGPFAVNPTLTGGYLVNPGGDGQCIGDGATGASVTDCLVAPVYNSSDAATVWSAFGQPGVWNTTVVNVPPLLWSQTSFGESPGAPNGDDSNDDGIPDSYQFNVASVQGPNDEWVTIVIPDNQGCSLYEPDLGWTDAHAYKEDPQHSRITDVMVGFNIYCLNAGTTVPVTLIYDQLYDVDSDSVLRQYNPYTNEYQTVDGAVFDTMEIDSNVVTTVQYDITDGGNADTDGTADRVLKDPVGIASYTEVASTPTNNVAVSQSPGNSAALAETGQDNAIIQAGAISLFGVSTLTLGYTLLKRQSKKFIRPR